MISIKKDCLLLRDKIWDKAIYINSKAPPMEAKAFVWTRIRTPVNKALEFYANIKVKVFVSFLILLVSLVGCGMPPSSPALSSYFIDPETEPYVLRFQKEAEKRNLNITINANILINQDILNDFAATCTYSTRTIAIRKDYWNKINDLFKEIIVFHELGHCVLLEKHIDIIGAIMNPDALYYWHDYENNKDAEIDRLFNDRKIL